MGQKVVGCCERDPKINQQMLITIKKMNEPQESGDANKKSILQSRLLQSNNLQQLFKNHLTAVPTLNEQVKSTIASLSTNTRQIDPLKLPYDFERGKHRSDYYKFDNTGVIYNGEWKDELPHGFGQNYYPNQSYYQGTFVEGVPFGYGRFINSNGYYYEGDIKYGRANGTGIYQNSEVVYRGQFKDNQKHGRGVEKTRTSMFEGNFEYDEKVEGFFNYGDNSYEGTFADDTFNGKGKLTNSKGVYYGNFKDGLQHGYGQYSWKDGSIYRGYFKKGQRDGQGEYFNSKNSSIARGIWKNGVLNGVGQYSEPTGVKHKCIWQNSKIKALIQ